MWKVNVVVEEGSLEGFGLANFGILRYAVQGQMCNVLDFANTPPCCRNRCILKRSLFRATLELGSSRVSKQ